MLDGVESCHAGTEAGAYLAASRCSGIRAAALARRMQCSASDRGISLLELFAESA